MTMISKDIEKVKRNILDNFRDPVDDNSIVEFLSGSSKMIRSRLVILYLKAQNYEIPSMIYQILAATELIHNASLLHDDVIDNAEFRRGKKTIAKKFDSKISILAGDYLLPYAIEKLLEINNIEILNLFKDCTKKMSEGEFKQYFLRNKIPSFEDYLEICKNKTAILFSTALEACSIIANFSVKESRNIGILFGLYFQFKNDLDKDSAQNDKLNNVYTIKDILGVEKTKNLLDNYKEEIGIYIKKLPNNIYTNELEDLINKI